MRLACVADTHIGNHKRNGGPVVAGLNTRCLEHLDALQDAREAAKMADARAMVLLGDVFDSVKPEPQIIAKLITELSSGVASYLLVGNHDQVSIAADDHALAPIDKVPDHRISVIESPRVEVLRGSVEVALLLVPFRPGAAAGWLPELVAYLVSDYDGDLPDRRVLCIHLGVADDETPSFLRDAPDAISVGVLDRLCRELGIQAVTAGNWHGRKVWKRKTHIIVQVGALVPCGWDDPQEVGTLAYLEWGKQHTVPSFSYTEIPGPRFMTVRSEKELLGLVQLSEHERFYVRWIVPPEEMTAAFETAGALGFRAVEIRPEESDRTEHEAAARATQSFVSVGEAVHEFVLGLSEVPPGIDRQRVSDVCMELLEA